MYRQGEDPSGYSAGVEQDQVGDSALSGAGCQTANQHRHDDH